MTPEELKKHVIREIKTFPKTYKVVDDNADESSINCEARFDGGIEGQFKVEIDINDANVVTLIETVEEFSDLYRNPWREKIKNDLKFFETRVNKLLVTT